MLTCEICGRRVYDVDFMDDDGQVLCEDCYEKWLDDIGITTLDVEDNILKELEEK